ncbi:hypothetical protein F4774DRAFT_69805 [Daldinia eschscholtzii]|nr:hypothetical protein F4774DRAFT_69805 [Daldinia eschscholtzii]
MLGGRGRPTGCRPSGCHTKQTHKANTSKAMPCFIRTTTNPCHTRKPCDAPCCRSEVERRDQTSSKYCKKHTCEHFWEPLFNADRCQNHKQPEDSVCPLHIGCIAVGCMNGRIQYYDRSRAGTSQYRRWRYCIDHKCSAPDCSNERATVGTANQYRPFCGDHNCRADNCPNRVIEGTDCCQAHKCQVPNCMTRADSRSRLCFIHNRCEWVSPSCDRPKEMGRKYCAEHLRCQTPGCGRPKLDGSIHCAHHTCRERGCNISSGEFDFCLNHRCEWEEGCEHPRSGDRYCLLHSCRSEGCPECVNDTGIFCDAHACSRDGCKVEAKPCLENKCYERKLPFRESMAIF